LASTKANFNFLNFLERILFPISFKNLKRGGPLPSSLGKRRPRYPSIKKCDPKSNISQKKLISSQQKIGQSQKYKKEYGEQELGDFFYHNQLPTLEKFSLKKFAKNNHQKNEQPKEAKKQSFPLNF